jgi:hypothetical protein
VLGEDHSARLAVAERVEHDRRLDHPAAVEQLPATGFAKCDRTGLHAAELPDAAVEVCRPLLDEVAGATACRAAH